MSSTLITSKALEHVGASAISRMMARVNALTGKGVDVIGLHVGEPDFDTPDNIGDAGVAAIRAGDTHYPPMDGSAALKDAIIAKYDREIGIRFDRSEVAVTGGAKMMIFCAFFATLRPGDEVIVPAPYWTNYVDIVRMMQAVPVVVDCPADNGFFLDPADLERAITDKTRWLMLNSPGNPSGAVYGRADLSAVASVLERHPNVWLLSDDIYEHLVFDGAVHATMLDVAPQLRDRTLTISGVSKGYAMTGWRIGWGVGPADLMTAASAVISQSTSAASGISQAAAVEALQGPQDSVAEFVRAYERRRDLLIDGLARVPGLSCAKPAGAFYAFVDVSGYFGSLTPDGAVISTDADFADFLLDAARVAVIPGSAFGSGTHVRLSFASDESALAEAARRIAEACRTVTPADEAKEGIE